MSGIYTHGQQIALALELTDGKNLYLTCSGKKLITSGQVNYIITVNPFEQLSVH